MFADKASDNEKIEHESHMKFAPDSEDDSVCEESDIDDSTAMPY